MCITDMGILLFIQFANASIAFYETTKAADAVSALKNSLKPIATVKRDGKMQQVEEVLITIIIVTTVTTLTSLFVCLFSTMLCCRWMLL